MRKMRDQPCVLAGNYFPVKQAKQAKHPVPRSDEYLPPQPTRKRYACEAQPDRSDSQVLAAPLQILKRGIRGSLSIPRLLRVSDR